MVTRRTTPNRFSDQSGNTSGVLSGIQQELDPRYNKSFVQRNLKEFPSLPQKPKAYRHKTDPALRRLATKAVLKQRGIKRTPLKRKTK